MSQSLYPPDLVNQLRIFAALAELREAQRRAINGHLGRGYSVPISFQNIPSNFKVPLYWVDDESDIPNEGIVAGEIIGHRCWRMKSTSGLLWSMCLDHCWLPGQRVEGDTRRYGVHSFKRGCHVLEYVGYFNTDTVVVGTIKMWGEVVEHERGYRAQYARIRSLDSIVYHCRSAVVGQDMVHGYWAESKRGARDDKQLLTLREIYGCEV